MNCVSRRYLGRRLVSSPGVFERVQETRSYPDENLAGRHYGADTQRSVTDARWRAVGRDSKIEQRGKTTYDGRRIDQGVDAWFVPGLVEVIDHFPGLEITIGDKQLVRDESGEWHERKRHFGRRKK